ncbi:hypothetical protein FB451DRAFT_1467481 [Mycena latifolia]|nr:hypothetical protein FB451DRAFT_1467481 [Mycena latifolia]
MLATVDRAVKNRTPTFAIAAAMNGRRRTRSPSLYLWAKLRTDEPRSRGMLKVLVILIRYYHNSGQSQPSSVSAKLTYRTQPKLSGRQDAGANLDDCPHHFVERGAAAAHFCRSSCCAQPYGATLAQSIASWLTEKSIQLNLIFRAVWGIPGIGIRRPTGYALFTLPLLKGYSQPFSQRVSVRGASGTVFRSVDGRHVVKVFRDEQTARSEATLLKMCLDDPQLRVPTSRGLYSNTDNFAIVMSYAGTTMPHIFSPPDAQNRYNRNGIHHNDVRAENLMVNPYGVVTLVDFDKAVKTDGVRSRYLNGIGPRVSRQETK